MAELQKQAITGGGFLKFERLSDKESSSLGFFRILKIIVTMRTRKICEIPTIFPLPRFFYIFFSDADNLHSCEFFSRPVMFVSQMFHFYDRRFWFFFEKGCVFR